MGQIAASAALHLHHRDFSVFLWKLFKFQTVAWINVSLHYDFIHCHYVQPILVSSCARLCELMFTFHLDTLQLY